MKTLRTLIAILLIIGLSEITQAQTKMTSYKKKQTVPEVTIAPFGGIIMPLGVLADNFKPGGSVGLDVGYRVNKEMGFFGKFGYHFMNSKLTGAPVGNYIEFSAGPRYYFTKPELKSTLFVEGGFGGYSYNQDSFVNPDDTLGSVVNEINDLRTGLNAGLGANLAVSELIDIMVRGKYNVVFTPSGSNSFITIGAGLGFKIR